MNLTVHCRNVLNPSAVEGEATNRQEHEEHNGGHQSDGGEGVKTLHRAVGVVVGLGEDFVHHHNFGAFHNLVQKDFR